MPDCTVYAEIYWHFFCVCTRSGHSTCFLHQVSRRTPISSPFSFHSTTSIIFIWKHEVPSTQYELAWYVSGITKIRNCITHLSPGCASLNGLPSDWMLMSAFTFVFGVVTSLFAPAAVPWLTKYCRTSHIFYNLPAYGLFCWRSNREHRFEAWRVFTDGFLSISQFC